MSEQHIRTLRNQKNQAHYRLQDLRLDLDLYQRELETARYGEDEELITNLESDVQAAETDIAEAERGIDDLEREIEDLEREEI